MKKTYLVVLVFILPFFSTIVNGIAIGIAPSLTTFEAIPGNSYRIEVIIDVRGEGKIPIELKCSEIDFSVAREDVLKFNLSQTSEENVCSWLTFLEGKVIVEDTKGFVWVGGKQIPADKITYAIVNVPKDAEPGYHLGHVDLLPRVEATGRGYGVGIITSAASTFVINVEGNAIRSAKPINFLASWVDENRLRVNTIVENNGTVTMRIRVDDLQLIRDNKTIKFPPSSLLVKPKQIAYIPSDIIQKIEPGDYKVKAKISWLSGGTEFEGMVRVPVYVKIPVARAVEVAKPKVPIYIFLIPIIVLVLIILKLRSRKKFYREF
jgi:hypothetical protein